MTFQRHIVGLALLCAGIGPLVVGAWWQRNYFVPNVRGAPARLAETIIVLAALLAIGQALGGVGLFRPWPVLLACMSVGGAAFWIVPRPSRARRRVAPPAVASIPRLHKALAALIAATVGVAWSSRVLEVLRVGVGTSDSVWYHLPFAARFLQEGSLTGLHFANGEAFVTFHPANAELLHALGFMPFGNDFLSPLINLLLLPSTLLAGWCIGRPRGLGPAALAATAIVLMSPVMYDTQPGEAMNDLVALFFLLAAVALMINAEGSRAALVISGVAAGLALGTRVTMVLPVLVLGVSVVAMTPRSGRKPMTITWAFSAVVAGSYWYLRNLVQTGSPTPNVRLGIGPLSLPAAEIPSERFGASVARYAADTDVWRSIFRPGLALALGPTWLLVLGLATAGAVLAAFSHGRPMRRAVGVTALAAVLAYAATPSTAFGVNTASRAVALPIFAFNVRYLTPALVVGLALLPLVPALGSATGRSYVLTLYASMVLVQVMVAETLWKGLGILVTAAFLTVIYHRLTRRPRSTKQARGGRGTHALSSCGVIALVLLLGTWPLARRYLSGRYADVPLYTWVRDLPPSRIAISGFAVQYPLYGPELSNHVQYVGERGRHGSFAAIPSCSRWREVLRRDRYDYVVVPVGLVQASLGYDLARWNLIDPPSEPPESGWTRSDPNALLVFEGGGAAVYRLKEGVSLQGCPEGDTAN